MELVAETDYKMGADKTGLLQLPGLVAAKLTNGSYAVTDGSKRKGARHQ